MEPFNQRAYGQGFEHAILDIREDGIEYAEEDQHKTGSGWYAVGYRTALKAYKSGAPTS